MSKKSSHKYFVNQRHREKLESKVYAHRYNWANVIFITKEPDPRYEREHPYRLWYYEKSIDFNTPKIGTDYYLYYNRPEVTYSVKKYHPSSEYSTRHKFLRKKASKKIRAEGKQGKLYQNGQFKKVCHISWDLD